MISTDDFFLFLDNLGKRVQITLNRNTGIVSLTVYPMSSVIRKTGFCVIDGVAYTHHTGKMHQPQADIVSFDYPHAFKLSDYYDICNAVAPKIAELALDACRQGVALENSDIGKTRERLAYHEVRKAHIFEHTYLFLEMIIQSCGE